jgi:hypothetical protein
MDICIYPIKTPANGFDSEILAPGKTFTHNFHTAVVCWEVK